MADPILQAEKHIAHEKRDADASDLNDKEIDAGYVGYHGIDTRVLWQGVDEVYERKVSVLNAALIDLRMGRFQWQIVALTGLGWFIDNLSYHLQFWMQAITIISPAVKVEFSVDRITFLTAAKYAGLVIGSTLWPMTADFIGRRLAFNITLLLSSVAGLVGAGSPNFAAIAVFCAFIGVGTGGNQPVDSAIFLEYIPATDQCLLTIQSAFWSVGLAVAALIGWLAASLSRKTQNLNPSLKTESISSGLLFAAS
ncbi:major facilitator superfamily domain-containing protein [Aspergillus heterothallicus]